MGAAHGGVTIPSPVSIVLVIAGVGFVMWKRMRGEAVKDIKRMLVLPLVFVVLGVANLTGSRPAHLDAASVAFLVVGGLISVGLGAVRGATIELFTKDGFLWQRYRGVTVALWAVLIAVKLLLVLVAHGVGAHASSDLMLSLGLSLAGEAALVAPRALSTGAAFAPREDASKHSGPGRSEGSRSDRWAGPGRR